VKILFRIVQPWGPKIADQSTVISEHAVVGGAAAERDARFRFRPRRTDAVNLSP
jgi:hypothetical protein